MKQGSSLHNAIAIAAHPDDIEFYMAGTLLLLRERGYAIHYMTLASGNCGSAKYSATRTRALRRAESKRAARILGATYHASLVNDLEILYELRTLRRLAAVIRRVKPQIVLTHSPQDYMEDHMNTSRLAVTAAFARGMRNFRTIPPTRAISGAVTVYHAMPHGLRDNLGHRVFPGLFVDTSAVHEHKRNALSAHKSQQSWLEASQGMGSYLRTMDRFSLDVGKMSRRFKHAEGWRRHLHFGLCVVEADPLLDSLRERCLVNLTYLQGLEEG
jgi:N-acetylglucosamine malate deacetylase 1